MATPTEIVDGFIAAIERQDIDAAAAFVADDISYENMPMKPIVGRDAMVETLRAFLGSASEVDWPIVSQVADGNRVMNERVDRFKLPGGWLELPVAGVFEINDDGLITLWRDYFDLSDYQRQSAAVSSAD